MTRGEQEVVVYDGRCGLGTVVERGVRFEAFTPAGKSLGLFNRFKSAADALYHERCHSFDGAT